MTDAETIRAGLYDLSCACLSGESLDEQCSVHAALNRMEAREAGRKVQAARLTQDLTQLTQERDDLRADGVHSVRLIEQVAANHKAEAARLRAELEEVRAIEDAARDFARRFQLVWAGSEVPELGLDTEASRSFVRLLAALTGPALATQPKEEETT